jgi:xylulokinase
MSGTLLGLDIGSSSVKATLLDVHSGKAITSATSPSTELTIEAVQPGWAEQHPDLWWEHVCKAVLQIKTKAPDQLKALKGIGIAYQMHGLVLVDAALKPLRPAIIWCDSRAVQLGEAAGKEIGIDTTLARYGNSPGNFTAAKLAWVKVNEPEVYGKAKYLLLPGDYIALKLTGTANSTPGGLSEGVLWDFSKNAPALEVCRALGISHEVLPPLVPALGLQGEVSAEAARELGIPAGTPITYRAGDQPNNALALNVLNPGEVAANAGTSGVVYGVSSSLGVDRSSRVNNFLHVSSTPDSLRVGMLLCVNGAGSLYRWLRHTWGGGIDYPEMNALAAGAPIGARGLSFLPYGNGAERSLNNAQIGGQLLGLEVNTHERGDLFRAAQEGIVFALKYGVEIMRSMGLAPTTIRAGDANLFKSEVFCSAFTSTLGTPLELYSTDGAEGAARGAGIGAKIFTPHDAFTGLSLKALLEPDAKLVAAHLEAYERWKMRLIGALQQ